MYAPPDPLPTIDKFNEYDNHMKKLFSLSLIGLDIHIRTLCTLERAGIKTIGQLVSKTKYDIENIRRLGVTSIAEIDRTVKSLGLTYDMKVM